MKLAKLNLVGCLILLLQTVLVPLLPAAEPAPHVVGVSQPSAGEMQIIFHGGTGPFRIERRTSLDPLAPWVNIPEALVTELQAGVFMAFIPTGPEDLEFYRVASESDGIVELKGWTILAQLTPPGNGQYYVPGESPVVTVTILDTFAQRLTRNDFSSLNLYMHGPEDPQKTVTASRILNASTNRAVSPHHYVDLKRNPAVQVNGTRLIYPLRPVTDEAPGTYTVSVRAVLAADTLQQIMKMQKVQIGTSTVETAVVEKAKCAACHEGPVSGKTYLHHIDPSGSSLGSWSLDFEPVASCKPCHNNDGYAAYRDTNAPGGRVTDHIVRRVHGVHMGEHLKLPFNTNDINGDFRHYRHVLFPADVRNCTSCHVDDRWKTKPSRLACGSCHDTTWFGPAADMPAGMIAHAGGPRSSDTGCWICHPPEGPGDEYTYPIVDVHRVPAPRINPIHVSMTPPANGTHYVAGERPLLTLVINDDTRTNAIDHTKVTDANFSTAALFVYGPRSRAVPVLTTTARNGNAILRASVSNNKDGPWAINGKIFKIAINGSAPQEITITGASNLVTAAEVVASLNPVITNLNGGAKASVSGARVNIKTLIRGTNARVEIYNGDVTTAMVWKRPPNTVLEPDVTVAAGIMPANDLRSLTDPLDYADPMVTRQVDKITYQLDDVAGLKPGTYGVYVYHLPRAGKIAGLSAPTGVGHLMFQVGTSASEKKVASNCTDCHADTIWHLYEGPIHAEPFDTDYCNACHDYGQTSTGDMFKNQGGTSLNGWSGFGAMPISRRVHGVHNGHYLTRPEEIYANATHDTFGNIIFPQDIRNCTKCHSQSNSWKEEPSRMACLGCHDTDLAKAHGTLMTLIDDPSDPYGPNSLETCIICHGAGTEFSPDKVHRIANPYVPPYPREAAE